MPPRTFSEAEIREADRLLDRHRRASSIDVAVASATVATQPLSWSDSSTTDTTGYHGVDAPFDASYATGARYGAEALAKRNAPDERMAWSALLGSVLGYHVTQTRAIRYSDRTDLNGPEREALIAHERLHWARPELDEIEVREAIFGAYRDTTQRGYFAPIEAPRIEQKAPGLSPMDLGPLLQPREYFGGCGYGCR